MEKLLPNFVEVETSTHPFPTMPVRQAAERVNRHTVFINNKVSKGDLDYSYAYWGGSPEQSGQKVIILNHKWKEFEEACRMRDMEKGKLMAYTPEQAAKAASCPIREIYLAMRDGDVDLDENTGKIIRNTKFESFIDSLKE